MKICIFTPETVRLFGGGTVRLGADFDGEDSWVWLTDKNINMNRQKNTVDIYIYIHIYIYSSHPINTGNQKSKIKQISK